MNKLWWRWVEYEYERSLWMEAGSHQWRLRKLSPPTRPKTSSIGLALLMPLPHQVGRDSLALCVVL